MTKYRPLAFLLALSILLAPVSLYAQNLTLNQILSEIAKSQTTSLQRLDRIDKYKGQTVKGDGKVKDVLKTYGEPNEAMVYLRKSFGAKEYELVLATDRASAETIRKGETVRFEGAFLGMSFETLRFGNVKILRKKFAWWPF